MMKKLYIVLFILLTSGCVPKSKTAPVDNVPTGPTTSLADLSIEYNASEFNDSGSNWRDITVQMLLGGDIGTINTLSEAVYSSSASAMTKVKISFLERNDSTVLNTNRNNIPHIRLKEKTNVSYYFDYTKTDPVTGIIVSTYRGSFISGNDGYAYLPIINVAFGNKLFISDVTTQQETYLHRVKILPIAVGVVSDTYKAINFKIAVTTPLQGMEIQNSFELSDFSLFNRWKKFFSGTDYTTNTDLPLGKIVSTSSPPATKYDLKVVFKTAPLLKTTQTLFVERTIDDLAYQTLGTITPQRGVRYYQKQIALDSKNHFQHKIKINDTTVSPDVVGGNTYSIRNLPASTAWYLGFSYDFTKSTLYTPGQTLLSPLKPQCHLLSGSTFNPIVAYDNLRAHDANGFYTACHPDTNIEETMTVEESQTATIDLINTWYDAFSYRKSKTLQNNNSLFEYDAGNFYGIKDMDLSSSGCIKIYIRTASNSAINPNLWEQKSTTSGGCGDGWSEYLIGKSDTLSNYLNEFAPYIDLSISVQGLLNSTVETRPDFYFNGNTFDKTNRIY